MNLKEKVLMRFNGKNNVREATIFDGPDLEEEEIAVGKAYSFDTIYEHVHRAEVMVILKKITITSIVVSGKTLAVMIFDGEVVGADENNDENLVSGFYVFNTRAGMLAWSK